MRSCAFAALPGDLRGLLRAPAPQARCAQGWGWARWPRSRLVGAPRYHARAAGCLCTCWTPTSALHPRCSRLPSLPGASPATSCKQAARLSSTALSALTPATLSTSHQSSEGQSVKAGQTRRRQRLAFPPFLVVRCSRRRRAGASSRCHPALPTPSNAFPALLPFPTAAACPPSSLASTQPTGARDGRGGAQLSRVQGVAPVARVHCPYACPRPWAPGQSSHVARSNLSVLAGAGCWR